MSQPIKIPAPGNPGQTKTMFYNEGNPAAVLIVRVGSRQKVRSMNFSKAEGALAWCRHNGAMLVYCPVALDRN